VIPTEALLRLCQGRLDPDHSCRYSGGVPAEDLLDRLNAFPCQWRRDGNVLTNNKCVVPLGAKHRAMVSTGLRDQLKERPMTECYSCRENERIPSDSAPRERVFDDGRWRVAHAFGVAVSGWMVIVARRHVTSMGQLSAEEAATLGPLIVALSRALEQRLGVPKTYVAFFAEAEGFQHLHIHIIPRANELPEERRGPGIFTHHPHDTPVSPQEMDRVADSLRPLLSKRLT
jgi:diadenosine tetraphosphate (Ap4A) HIT family hydrolase